jgi:hypothetical protein
MLENKRQHEICTSAAADISSDIRHLQQTSDCGFCSHSMNIASMNFCCYASGCRVLQAMATVVSLSRLAHSTQGALSTSRLSHHPLLFQRRSQICQDIGSISAIWISPVMDLQVKYLWGLTPVASASLEKVQMFPNMEKLSMRIGCSGSRERTFRVSAFISASAAEINFEHGKSNVPLAAQLLLLLLQQNDQDSVPCKIQTPPCGGFY